MARRRNAPPALPSPAPSALARPAPAAKPLPAVSPEATSPRPSTLQGEVVREVVRPVPTAAPVASVVPKTPAPPKAPVPPKAPAPRSTGRIIGMAGMLGAFGLLIYYVTTRKQHPPRSFIPAALPRLTPAQSIARAGEMMRRNLLGIKRPLQAVPPGTSLEELLNRRRP